MKKNQIKNDSQDYMKIAKTLLSLRPICHIVSAITTVCFVVSYLLSRQEIEPYLLYWGGFSYLFMIVGSVLLAWKYENIVSGVIDALGMLASKNHSRRLTFAVGAISVPLIFIAASTSFVGSSEVASQSADNLIQAEFKEVVTRIDKNSTLMLTERKRREQQFVKSRAQLRNSIVEKWEGILKEIPIKNKKKFNKANDSEWHFNSLQRVNSQDSSKYIKKKKAEIAAHDKETDSLLRDIHDKHFKAESAQSENNESAIVYTKNRTEKKATRFEFFGRFFGIVAIIALLISIISSIAAYQICEIIQIKPSEMKSKSAFASILSPTLSKKSKKRGSSGIKQQKEESHGSGVGEFYDTNDLLKRKAQALVSDINSENLELQKQATHELIQVIENLEANGIEVFWNSENKNEIKFNQL